VGQASNVVTKVKAGSKVTIVWAETVPHPGHYRISFSQDRKQFVEPVPVVTNNNCVSAPIDNAPALPVLVDGIDKHDPTMNTQEITIPNTPCERCTIQVLEFMSNHAPPCFYHHCADVQVVTDLDGGPEAIPTGGGTDPNNNTPTGSKPGSRRVSSSDNV